MAYSKGGDREALHCSGRAVELHRALCTALQPALETDDEERPAEREAGHGDSDIQEHHHVVVAPAHGGDRDFLGGELEDKTATCEEERRKRFSGRARWQDTARRAKPEEEVGQATKDGETRQKPAPEHVDLNLEEVLLEVSRHGCACNANAKRREGVEAGDVARRLRDGFL